MELDTDFASQIEEREREAALKRRMLEGPPATGFCLNPLCEMELEEDGRRWCDSRCRDEWERLRS